jgi:hypothetical protein
MTRSLFSTTLCCALVSCVFLSRPAGSHGQPSDRVGGAAYYVSADARPGGDGSRRRPFRSLSHVEAASAAGDTIHLLSSDSVLDGGIRLKPGQRLIGIGPDGEMSAYPADRVRLTNTAPLPGGVMVELSRGNEVAGIHFVDMGNHAISGAGTDYSGAHIHHATFSGNAGVHVEDERGLVYAISLDASAGVRDGVTIEDSRFADGEDLGAIRVFQSGESRGRYRFQRNEFSDLGGRAYFVRTQDRSFVETIILDSAADNIGRGERNSDSIIPYLMGQSEQVMLVRNYRFNNTNQEGNQSNTGIEAYMFGQPRPDEANWCTGCTLTLTILDSVIENAVTDPIQFSNSGRNSRLRYEIRNTRIIGGSPRQGDGGISLNLQGSRASGGSTTLLVEDTDVIGTSVYGFTLNDRGGGGGHAVVVDLGGGALGSRGNNRFLDNEKGALRVSGHGMTAQHNWWGGAEPVVHDSGDRPSQDARVLVEPVLDADPRRESTP